MHFTSKDIAVEFVSKFHTCSYELFALIFHANMYDKYEQTLTGFFKKWNSRFVLASFTIVLVLCQSENTIFTTIIKRVIRKIGHYKER